MQLKELKAQIDGIKSAISETVHEEVVADRVKTESRVRKDVRQETNDRMTTLEKITLAPENAQHIGRLIAAIEGMRSINGDYTESHEPISQEQFIKIAEARKITLEEAETISHAVRGSEMLNRLEAMKPQVLTAIMEGFEVPKTTESQSDEEGDSMIDIRFGGVNQMTDTIEKGQRKPAKAGGDSS